MASVNPDSTHGVLGKCDTPSAPDGEVKPSVVVEANASAHDVGRSPRALSHPHRSTHCQLLHHAVTMVKRLAAQRTEVARTAQPHPTTVAALLPLVDESDVLVAVDVSRAAAIRPQFSFGLGARHMEVLENPVGD